MPEVVCAVDESKAATAAVTAAIDFCRKHDANLRLLGIVKPVFGVTQPAYGEQVRRFRESSSRSCRPREPRGRRGSIRPLPSGAATPLGSWCARRTLSGRRNSSSAELAASSPRPSGDGRASTSFV